MPALSPSRQAVRTMKTVLYEIRDEVAVITLNRPERKNGLTAEMLSSLFVALARADDDVSARSVVIRGAGNVFSAGGDIAVETKGDTGSKPLPNFGRMASVAIRTRKPTVAAIETYCIGGALAIALLCDVRFAAPSTVFSTAFTRIGVVAELGIAWTLPRVVGTGAALDLLLSSRKLDTDEALRMGLVNFVAPSDRLQSDAHEYAHELAQRSPASMATIKAQLLAGYQESLDAAFVASDVRMADAVGEPDWVEGYQAFLAKRAPRFSALAARDSNATT
jgi:enoyl-CoA hydratase/carnithine racemase